MVEINIMYSLYFRIKSYEYEILKSVCLTIIYTSICKQKLFVYNVAGLFIYLVIYLFGYLFI